MSAFVEVDDVHKSDYLAFIEVDDVHIRHHPAFIEVYDVHKSDYLTFVVQMTSITAVTWPSSSGRCPYKDR